MALKHCYALALCGVLEALLFLPEATAITTQEWSAAINVAGRQRMLSQKMSKEFLLVAKGINISENKVAMASTIALFDASLDDLVNGSDMIPAAPNSNITDQLDVVAGLWSTFKALLEDNVDASPIGASTLADVASQSVPLLVQANEAVTLYVTAADDAGATVPGTTVNIAGRQRMLSQRMSKEALLVALGVDAATNRENLNSTMNLFATSHVGLLYGDVDTGLTATRDACILQQMLKVTDLWAQFQPLIQPITDGETATDDTLQQIADLNPTLLTTMNSAVGLYASASPSCTPSASSDEWSTVINVAGRQRMLSQKMSKEFLLVAKGIDTATNKDNLAATMALFESSLWKLIQGSTADTLPAAPTQAVADQLLVVEGLWSTFKALLEDNVDASPIGASTLADVASQSVPLLVQANDAVTLYVTAADDAGATVPGTTVNIAGRQRMLSQRMSKEALLVALGVDAATNRENLNSTMNLFATSHVGLIDGDSDMVLPGTENECILQQMNVVEALWVKLSEILTVIRDGGDITDEMLEQLAELNPKLLSEANAVVSLFVAGSPTCLPDDGPGQPSGPGSLRGRTGSAPMPLVLSGVARAAVVAALATPFL